MALRTFFADPPLCPGTVEIRGGEFDHMTRVIRLGPGDRVYLIDGAGSRAEAAIDSVGKDFARLLVESVENFGHPAPFGISLATALPKGRRARYLIEKCTELGARDFRFVSFLRSVRTQPGQARLESLRSAAREALKQSGRVFMPRIAAPVRLSDFLAREIPGRRLLLSADSPRTVSEFLDEAPEGDLVVACGPEGGLEDEERSAMLDAGFEEAAVSRGILRMETACVSAMSLVEEHGLRRGKPRAGP
jgi:16S rRNA (uracil1498-N3)-methyltransferase